MARKLSPAMVVLAFFLSVCLVTSGAWAEVQTAPNAQTYTGTASGYGGSIRVTVELLDGKLIGLTATGKGETEGIGSVAVDEMAARMLEANDWDVDIVTGATMTSDAMREAAKKAMDEAGL